MADWSGTARSNKFRVKDRDLFIGWVARFNPPGPNRKDYESDEEFEDARREHEHRCQLLVREEGHHMVLLANTESGDWPQYYSGMDCAEEPIAFEAELVEHLAENSVVILYTVGSEKFAYLTGYANAYTADGQECGISLAEIVGMARDKFGPCYEVMVGGA